MIRTFDLMATNGQELPMTHRGSINRRTGKTTARTTKRTHWSAKGHRKAGVAARTGRSEAARPSAPKQATR